MSGRKKYIPSTKRKIDGERAMWLWSQGKTDEQIADGCGVSRDSVANWRRRNGRLPPNRKKKRHCPPWLEKVAAVNAMAREAGMTYGKYMATPVIVRGRRK